MADALPSDSGTCADSTDRRIVIISDTHLGRPGHAANSPDALRPLWRDAGELIVNGDVAELHDVRYRARAARHVMRLQALCEEDGVELTLISGNHDPFLTDVRHLTLAGGEIFVTHGDVLHPSISPWNSNARELRRFNERALRMLNRAEGSDFVDQLSAAQHASFRKWDEPKEDGSGESDRAKRLLVQSRKLASTLWYWHTLPRRAAEFAQRHAPDSRFFIFGHIHRAGIWNIDKRIIINTGCYGFAIRPRAVVVERDELSVWPIVRTNAGLYSLENKPQARFDLGSPQIAAA